MVKSKTNGGVRASKKVFDDIVAWVAEGKTLRAYCRQPNTPNFATVYGWIDKYPDFGQRFARARQIGFDSIADECFEIADEVAPVDDRGRTDAGYVSWQKNRIWTRTQLLAKWDRKRYGDGSDNAEQGDKFRETIQKVQIEVIGKDDAN